MSKPPAIARALKRADRAMWISKIGERAKLIEVPMECARTDAVANLKRSAAAGALYLGVIQGAKFGFGQCLINPWLGLPALQEKEK